MIRPSHAEKQFTASRVFTDRDDARGRFLAVCDEGLGPSDYKVLMWYGVGGLGKSALAREFERLADRLRDAAPNMPGRRRYAVAKVDFDDTRLRLIHEALLSLRLQLGRSAKLSFPAFDTAFARYFALSNPGADIRQKHPELFRGGESEILDDLVDWSEVGIELVAEAAKFAIPGVNLIYKYGARLTGRVREWWERRGKIVLRGLDDLRADQLLEKLPTYLGADLADAIKAEPGLLPVVILDTYEALWRESAHKDGEAAGRTDRWVRLLVQDAPGCLFVVLGRDRLRWHEDDPDWAAVVEDHLLGALSDADCDAFLAAVPVAEPAIRRQIIDGARGLPFYLDLQVDLYEDLVNAGERPDAGQFGGTHARILNRFLDHLGDYEEGALRLASYPLALTEADMNDLAAAFLGGAAHLNWRRLVEGRSFMTGDGAGRALMHSVLRDELQRREAAERPDLFRRIHAHLFAAYDAASLPAAGEPVSAVHEAAFIGGLHHLARADRDRTVVWVGERYAVFARAARWRTLETVLRQLLGIVRSAFGDEFPPVLIIRHNLALQIGLQGRYAEAEREFRAVWEIQRRPEVLGEEHPGTLTTRHHLAQQLGNLGRHAEAEAEFRGVLAIQRRPEVLGEEHPHTLTTRHEVAKQLGDQGRYAEAEAEYRAVLEIMRQSEVRGEAHPDALTVRANIAFQLGNLGRHAEAEAEFRAVLEVLRRPDVLGEEHPHTLTARHNVAQQLGSQGRHAEAERVFREVWEIQRRPDVLGEEHPHTLTTRANIAFQLGELGRHAEAEREFREVWEIQRRPDVLGEEHPHTLTARANIANQLAEQGRHAEAESAFREVLEIRRRPDVLGEEHPHTLVTRALVAVQIGKQGRHAEAEHVLRDVWEILRRPDILGEEHPATLTARGDLARRIGEQGRHDEAERIFREVLEIWRRPDKGGEDNPAVLRVRFYLARTLDRQNRREEATQLLDSLADSAARCMGADHPWCREVAAYIAGR